MLRGMNNTCKLKRSCSSSNQIRNKSTVSAMNGQQRQQVQKNYMIETNHHHRHYIKRRVYPIIGNGICDVILSNISSTGLECNIARGWGYDLTEEDDDGG